MNDIKPVAWRYIDLDGEISFTDDQKWAEAYPDAHDPLYDQSAIDYLRIRIEHYKIDAEGNAELVEQLLKNRNIRSDKLLERICKWLSVLAVILALWSCADAARAQSWEVRQLLADRGWHGVGGTVQVHQPTLEFNPPWVGVWERSARSNRYGDWAYVRVLINCAQWSQIPFGTLDEDHNFVLMADLIGHDPPPRWPERGTQAHRVVSAVCGLYGYREFKPAAPSEPNVVER